MAKHPLTPNRKTLSPSLAGAVLCGLLWPASAQALDKRFDLRVSGQSVQVGSSGTVKVQLTADDPWHMNVDFPTSLKLKETSGVSLGQLKFKKTDAKVLSEHKILFAIPVKAQRAGLHIVEGKLKFAICKADSCSPASAAVKLRIQAKAPAPVAPAPKKAVPKPNERSKPLPKKAKPQPKPKRAPKSPPPRKQPKAKAPSAPPQSSSQPLALEYLGRWMFDPIWGPDLTHHFFSLIQPPTPRR